MQTKCSSIEAHSFIAAHVVYFVSAPPEFEPPTFLRVVSDSEILVKLHPASNENGDVSHYYVVVVSNELAEGRQPDDFRLDEVPIQL